MPRNAVGVVVEVLKGCSFRFFFVRGDRDCCCCSFFERFQFRIHRRSASCSTCHAFCRTSTACASVEEMEASRRKRAQEEWLLLLLGSSLLAGRDMIKTALFYRERRNEATGRVVVVVGRIMLFTTCMDTAATSSLAGLGFDNIRIARCLAQNSFAAVVIARARKFVSRRVSHW